MRCASWVPVAAWLAMGQISPDFVQLLRNGIYWSAARPVPSTEAKTLTNVPRR